MDAKDSFVFFVLLLLSLGLFGSLSLTYCVWNKLNSDSGLSRSTVANIVYSIDIDCKPP